MFINPKTAVEKGWIQRIHNPDKQIQPNAIDFTVDDIQIVSSMPAHVSESNKTMRLLENLPLVKGRWELMPNRVYDGTSEVFVDIPEGVAAVLWTRSTFARNGVFIMSGLYDSGYKGHIGFTIYTPGGFLTIEPHTRIGQIGFIHSESAGLYSGGWNHQQGTHYTVPNVPSSLNQQDSQQMKPKFMEEPIASKADKSEMAQELEDTHKWDSDQGGKPAGTKNFI